MDLEATWYELFPYLSAIGGVVALFIRPDSTLLKISGALLVVAAITIFRLRWVHRRARFVALPTPADSRVDGGVEPG